MCILSKYFAFYVFFSYFAMLSPLRIVICMRQGGNNDKIVEEGIKKIWEGKNKIVDEEGNKNEKGEG